MNNLNPSLPCPHCHAPIQGGLVKGLAAVKECPSCHKKVKFKKPPVGEYFKAVTETFRYFCSSCLHRSGNTVSLFGTFPPIYQYGISYRLSCLLHYPDSKQTFIF